MFPSLPETVLENVSVPAVLPLTDQVNTWFPPPAIVALAGVGPEAIVAPAPPMESVGVVACAEASPELVTVTVTVIGWPVFTVPGAAAIVAAIAAGTCTVAGPALAAAVTGTLLRASVPLAVTLNVSVPVAVDW